MLYYFIINGREDIRGRVDAFLDAQLPKYDITYKKYYTEGVGDGTRFVRMYRDLYPRDEVCFVACGGSGTANEVASGLVSSHNKSMAILAFGETNDVIKYWPDRKFDDLGKILSGETKKIDIIKAGDSYCLNMINVGFDGMVAYDARRYMDHGLDAIAAYKKAVFTGILHNRFHRISVKADGKPVNRRFMLMCPIGNGQWCGGQYHSLPLAKNNDGMMDVYFVRPMAVIWTLLFFVVYLKGTHFESRFARHFSKYFRARELELKSKDLIYICTDGEISASTSFLVKVLPSAISIVIPAL